MLRTPRYKTARMYSKQLAPKTYRYTNVCASAQSCARVHSYVYLGKAVIEDRLHALREIREPTLVILVGARLLGCFRGRDVDLSINIRPHEDKWHHRKIRVNALAPEQGERCYNAMTSPAAVDSEISSMPRFSAICVPPRSVQIRL